MHSVPPGGSLPDESPGTALLAALPEVVGDELQAPALLAVRLERWYATPPRHYHTLAHVAALLAEWRTLREEREPAALAHPRELAAAVLFHDAVYVAGRRDNEARSAELADRHAPEHFPRFDGALVRQLIELSAHHGEPPPSDAGPTARLFLDMDMSILGAPPDEYRAYAAAVRAEFLPVVGSFRYRIGRRRFLRALLASPSIFLTERYRARMEEAARRNVGEELRARS